MSYKRAITVVAIVALMAAYLLENIVLATISCILLGFMVYKNHGSSDRCAVISTAEAVPEQLVKGWRDYQEIEVVRSRLRDKGLADQVMRLQCRAEGILSYLNDHPQSLHAAGRFINYYQERTASLVRKCVSLESAGISTPGSREVIQRTATILAGFEDAYEKQFAKVIDMQLLDMRAELKVAHQELVGDGIDCNRSALRHKVAPTRTTVPQPKSPSAIHRDSCLW